MTEIRKYEAKSADTRFKPGNRGKPKGARHRSTVMAEKLMADDVEDIVKAVATAAKTGDMSAARIVLDRLAPVRRGRPVQFDLPIGTDAAGISAAFDAVLNAVARGTLTREEGSAIGILLEARRKAIETAELDARLMALERSAGQ
jgi:hypothetical protein